MTAPSGCRISKRSTRKGGTQSVPGTQARVPSGQSLQAEAADPAVHGGAVKAQTARRL